MYKPDDAWENEQISCTNLVISHRIHETKSPRMPLWKRWHFDL